jgi:hypothetical protein
MPAMRFDGQNGSLATARGRVATRRTSHHRRGAAPRRPVRGGEGGGKCRTVHGSRLPTR